MELGEIAYNISQNTGINEQFLLAQLQLESGHGQSALALDDHNYGGITATEDMPRAVGTNWAHFKSDEDFVSYGSGFYPKFNLVGIEDPDEYIDTLCAEGYFPLEEREQYRSNFKSLLAENENQSYANNSEPIELDYNNLLVNNEDQSVTNTVNLRPESKYGLNLLGKFYRDEFGEPLMITGGAETWTHAGGEYSHHTGWKADVWGRNIQGGTVGGNRFEEFCASIGASATWEEDHWDIDFSGHDTRNPQQGIQLQFGSFWDYSGMGSTLDNEVGYQLEPLVDTSSTLHTPSWWETAIDNFVDSFLDTGFGSFARTIWGQVAHSEGADLKPIQQEDIDYVKTALKGDKEAQEFCLLNGIDSENIHWLVEQKLKDKQRRESIEQFKTMNDSLIEKGLVALGGIGGYVADPLNFIPMTSAMKVGKVVEVLRDLTPRIDKVKALASFATKNGLFAGATTFADDYQKTIVGRKDVDYSADIINAFLVGGISSGLMGAGAYKLGGRASKIAQEAEKTENRAVLNIMGANTSKVSSETIGNAMKLHDTNFGSVIKSKVYNALEKNNKIVATSYENARKLIEDASGIVLPKSVKALYVPNEDYTILLTDKVKPHEVDKLLAHEFGVHGGIKRALGEEGYTSLMDEVTRLSEQEGSIFNKARERAGSYDPEEIFAQAVEDDMLPKGFWSKVKGAVNTALKTQGFKGVKMNMEQIKEIMQKQIESKRNPSDIYVNEDGSTAFAGMKFSQDNLVNPRRLADVIELEQDDVTKVTQSRLGNWGLQKVGKLMEQGIFGLGINSLSNTFRKYVSRIWEDARGRGLGDVNIMPAETYKQQIVQQLTKPYMDYCSIRQNHVMQDKINAIRHPETSRRDFDKMTVDAYNIKYGGNKASARALSEYPEEVLKAMEKIHDFRTKQIELGKNSSRNIGSNHYNLIDDDWYVVDDELWRVTDRTKVGDVILGNFTNTAEKTAKEQAKEFFTDYFMKFAKRDVIKAKILRGIKLTNKTIKTENDKLIKEKGKDAELKELKAEVVTDDDVEAYLKKHIPNAVDKLMEGRFDPVMVSNDEAKLGKLSFLQERIPIDTTGILELPTGKQFSFDNNLRLYDMDDMVLKNINRFAGECALNTVFKDDRHLRNFLNKVNSQLQTAVANGKMNRGTATDEYRYLEKSIAEFRGLRAPEHSDETFGRFGALCRIAKNLSYTRNGANMGFNQFGELAGTIAYGGVRQLFHIIPKLGEWIDDLTAGKVDTAMVRSVEDFMFGSNLESKIFTHSWGDKLVRDSLTVDNIVNNKMKSLADLAHNLGKVTSAINLLPKMTESMLRGMRTGFITDSIREAHGDIVRGIFRNPFSPQKLKACHVTPEQWETIQEKLRQYSTMDNNGKITGLDVDKWFKEDVVSYQKWYNMIQLQAERGMTASNRQGNKNLLKSSNSLWSLFFQFKDYSLRSMNAQTFRAMTARDRDDLYATMLSVATNAGVYMARAGLTYSAYKASGMDEKAEKYKEYMFSNHNLAKAIATRSAMIGTPLSFLSDIEEATIADSSIRTTVDSIKNPRSKDMSAEDVVGNAVGQLPAVKELSTYTLDLANTANHAYNNKFTQRDLDTLTRLVPIPRLWLMTTFMDKGSSELTEYMGIPKKK